MITAGTILRSLALRQRQAEITAILDLPGCEREAVVQALAAVPPTARIDADKLVETVRREFAARAAVKQPDPRRAFGYSLTVMSDVELAALEADLARRIAEGGDGDAPFEPFQPHAPFPPGRPRARPSVPRLLERACKPLGRDLAPAATKP